ncbi:ladderlectin-like [Gambusia affinis]|uniref:ladderlectin-like n=1 Tax=Gambusia affinis TaxID=33528 RepID=UPI001CDCF889|nr:ladderlectin-like [Gambusia affinis]
MHIATVERKNSPLTGGILQHNQNQNKILHLGFTRICTALGANLASFHSHSEYMFLKNLVKTVRRSWDRTWVGGYDAVKERLWLWSDGSNFDYIQWGRGEPNNQGGRENCMEINLKGPTQYVNDEGCSRRNFFICAKNR